MSSRLPQRLKHRSPSEEKWAKEERNLANTAHHDNKTDHITVLVGYVVPMAIIAMLFEMCSLSTYFDYTIKNEFCLLFTGTVPPD